MHMCARRAIADCRGFMVQKRPSAALGTSPVRTRAAIGCCGTSGRNKGCTLTHAGRRIAPDEEEDHPEGAPEREEHHLRHALHNVARHLTRLQGRGNRRSDRVGSEGLPASAGCARVTLHLWSSSSRAFWVGGRISGLAAGYLGRRPRCSSMRRRGGALFVRETVASIESRDSVIMRSSYGDDTVKTWSRHGQYMVAGGGIVNVVIAWPRLYCCNSNSKAWDHDDRCYCHYHCQRRRDAAHVVHLQLRIVSHVLRSPERSAKPSHDTAPAACTAETGRKRLRALCRRRTPSTPSSPALRPAPVM